MKNNINERLDHINAFLESNKKPGLKSIHALRLEVKHLEAFMELMTLQSNFGARTEIPNRLEKLFHEAGRLRKFGLQMKAIESIAEHIRLSKPILFLEQLKIFEKKSKKKLGKMQGEYPAFKAGDFARHPEAGLSTETWRSFIGSRAETILELLNLDILADIRSLHQLRKMLKSILYVTPVCKGGVKPVRVFLKRRKRFMQAIESKIGSIHDTGAFISSLEKKQNLIQAGERDVLKKIKREWQHDVVIMRKNLKPLIPAVRQFALDLKDQSISKGRIMRPLSSTMG